MPRGSTRVWRVRTQSPSAASSSTDDNVDYALDDEVAEITASMIRADLAVGRQGGCKRASTLPPADEGDTWLTAHRAKVCKKLAKMSYGDMRDLQRAEFAGPTEAGYALAEAHERWAQPDKVD
eukprot:CAMPEP_0185294380 /NCGR_PEP_ID=MMETSP1363-20130426/7561_1 /TAXON_ID=38817 /ORGANISM="Gephyrocapsa oceanica, Strain RCC1303" /LENGTH=122 /DNA_ID=CAMNT_0027890829 /DNA_START=60 /DNA_END=428 /DNA_ORIENTATION=-